MIPADVIAEIEKATKEYCDKRNNPYAIISVHDSFLDGSKYGYQLAQSRAQERLRTVHCSSYEEHKVRTEKLEIENAQMFNALQAITESGVVDCMECQSHERVAKEALGIE